MCCRLGSHQFKGSGPKCTCKLIIPCWGSWQGLGRFPLTPGACLGLAALYNLLWVFFEPCFHSLNSLGSPPNSACHHCYYWCVPGWRRSQIGAWQACAPQPLCGSSGSSCGFSGGFGCMAPSSRNLTRAVTDSEPACRITPESTPGSLRSAHHDVCFVKYLGKFQSGPTLPHTYAPVT